MFPRHWARAEIRPQVLLVLAPLFACLNNGNPGDDSLGKLPVFQKDRRCGRKQRRYEAITNKNEGEREKKFREDKRRDNQVKPSVYKREQRSSKHRQREREKDD